MPLLPLDYDRDTVAQWRKALGIDIREYPVYREKKYHIMPGKDAFNLKSTHGLPLSIIMDICYQQDILIDLREYFRELEVHRARSRGKKLT